MSETSEKPVLALPTKIQIESNFSGFKEALKKKKEEIKAIELKDDASLTQLKLMVKGLKDFKNFVNDEKLGFTKDARDFVSTTNDLVKFVMDDTDEVIKNETKRITDYQLLVEAEEKKKQALLAQEAEKKKKLLENAGAEEKVAKIALLEHARKSILLIADANTYPELNDVFDKNVRQFPWGDYANVEASAEKAKNMIKAAATDRKAFVSIENPTETQIKEAQVVLKRISETVATIDEIKKKISGEVDKIVETAGEVADIKQEIKASETKAKGGLVKSWTYELLDISKVPVEFLQLNEVAVKNHISKNLSGTKIEEDDVTSIPGVRLFKKATTRL